MANRVVSELQQSPLPEIIERLGTSIANAQFAMDMNAIRIATMLGDVEKNGVQFSGETEKRSLLELGFTPTFYQLTEATVDARITLSMSQSREVSASMSATVGVTAYFVMMAATVSASYTNKYSFEASGSSAITAKFIAVPPPTILNQLLSTKHSIEQDTEED